MLSRRTFGVASSFALAQSILPAALAQGVGPYPNRTLKLVISNPAGGAVDLMARQYAERLSAGLRQPVIVEPRPGANGLIAGGAVSMAAPDGYTLLFTTNSITNAGLISASLLTSNPFRMEDLAPITLLAFAPQVFTIDAAVPATTLADFIRLVKANPKKYSYGSSGVGSTSHLLGETLNRVAGIDLLHVPFAGEAPATAALLSGTISAYWGSAGGMARLASAGKAKLLATNNGKRLQNYPDVPTFREAGIPEVSLPAWIGVFAPAATPKEVVQRLSEEFTRVGKEPAVHAKVMEFGFEPGFIGVPEFAGFVKSEQDKWAAIIKRVLT